MQGFVGADLLGFLDGMQGVRGSNPLGSTTTEAQVSLPLRLWISAVAVATTWGRLVGLLG